MSSFADITLLGRLGQDPDYRETRNGKAVCNLSVATNRPTKERETDWHRVTVWGKAAEIAREYLAKGRLVAIRGRLQYEEYDDREGVRRRVAVIHSSQITLVGDRPQSGHSREEKRSEPSGDAYVPSPGDDDIPF